MRASVGPMAIRPVAAADHDQIAVVCRLTGYRGGDATGMYCDDAVLPDVFATPYLHGPACFGWAWEIEGGARGYLLGTSDTELFQRWFVEDWWPSRRASHVPRTAADVGLLEAAADPARMRVPFLDDYPAHLHIDLMPDQQGQGAGRSLIEVACAALAAAGVRGVHLSADRANAAAQAFYPRVGFTSLASDASSVTWGRALA